VNEKIRLGISACLAGEKVRYDGADKFDPFLMETLGRYVEYVPVCPCPARPCILKVIPQSRGW
jgi:uncharacterized protein YbbK (DUF523 family)